MVTDRVLTEQHVKDVFKDCLVKDDEKETVSPVFVEGMAAGFHPRRLEVRRQEIHDMLSELPDEVRSKGGVSLSVARMDRHGKQWSRLPVSQMMLAQLGAAIGEVKYPMPADVWAVLPDGMPHIIVNQ